MQLVQDGTPLTYSEAKAIGVFTSPELTVQLDLGLGTASTTIWTCDLTHDYVTINAEYRT
jgi:glutamate N-acetyltransferase/amino-acid N-acetyltransferase